jgi:drug/metabolite transporter (DMT)-like permease
VILTPRFKAILLALFVTLVWSFSWILIKVGLEGTPPLLFGGLRYAFAGACLVLLVGRSPRYRREVAALSAHDWRRLIVLGLVYYAIGQGLVFVALELLPSVTLSLILNFTSIVVAVLGIFLLAERPTWAQFAGIGLFLLGALVYFYPAALPGEQVLGVLVAIACMLINAAGSILGRSINRSNTLSPLIVTTVSMAIGGALLLAYALIVEGWSAISLRDWLIIVWLAIVHTALMFTLWNRVLRVLTAVESNIINNTLLINVAVLAWVFLGEEISPQGMIGLGVALTGVLVVQLMRPRVSPPPVPVAVSAPSQT